MLKKHLFLYAVLFVLALAIAAQGAGVSETQPVKVVPGGRLEVIGGITVASMSGTPREIGVQHGQLLGKRLLETEAAFMRLMPEIPGGAIGRWLVRQYVMYKLSDIEKYLTTDELDEFKGVAEADPKHKGDYREILYYHVLQDIGQNYACTGLAVEGDASRLVGPVAGRNFDLDNRGALDPLRTVFYCRPSTGHAFAHVAWPGMLGAVSGMNDAGLSVMEFSAKSDGTSLEGVPVAFLVKRILRGASDIDQAVSIIKDTRRMGPNIFLLADTKRAVAVEFDSEKVCVRGAINGLLPVANHFFMPGLACDVKNVRQARYGDSRQRYDRMSRIAQRADRVGISEMAAVLRDHGGLDDRPLAWGDPEAINNYKCAHSVIFDTAERVFYISKGPMAYGEYAGFRLTKAGLEKAGDLPGDGYPVSPEGMRSAASDSLMQRAVQEEKDGKSDDAVMLAEKAATEDTRNYTAELYIGKVRMSAGDYSGAYSAYNAASTSAAKGSGSLARALAGRGEALMRLGKKDEAVRDFDAALSIGCSEEADKIAAIGLGR